MIEIDALENINKLRPATEVFDRLKRTYWGTKQLTLDYFLRGDTTICRSPSTTLSSQDNESPSLRSNCLTKNMGTVVRKESDPGRAHVNLDSVPGILPPHRDILTKVYNSTYGYSMGIPTKPLYSSILIYLLIGRKVINMTVSNPRQLRALGILSSGIEAIIRESKYYYRVKSQSRKGYYDVHIYHNGWKCDCPDFEARQQDCKHIYAVQFSMQLRLQVEKDVKESNKIEVQTVVDCPACGKYNVVRNGQRKCQKGTVQRYVCKDCGHRFVVDRELSRLKATPEVISVSMDLYFKGNSLAKIKHHLKMFYKLTVDRSTIMRWIHKFSKVLNEYSEKHRPEVGDIWNSDEMTINIRKDGVKKNNEWIWNLMDSDTRFLLASTITEQRFIKDARKVLKQGKDRSGKKPKALITDGLQAYNGANTKEFYDRSEPTIHYRTQSKRKYFLNQNIERLNGTVRERLKVMRGLDSMETAQAIVDGERFYYNYIKPHMSLDGMTPAQMAGLEYADAEDNAWLVHIKKAIREKRTEA